MVMEMQPSSVAYLYAVSEVAPMCLVERSVIVQATTQPAQPDAIVASGSVNESSRFM
jgi:hypothetical protein